jgi:hypothetical protein
MVSGKQFSLASEILDLIVHARRKKAAAVKLT